MKYAIVFIVMIFSFQIMPQAQNVPSSARLKKVKQQRGAEIKNEVEAEGFKWGSPVFMRIFKTEMELEVWIKKGKTFSLYKTYDICTYGGMGLGPKLKQGDGMAPEGFYFVQPKQMNPYSSFHLSFNLGYPNAYDRAYKRTGSALMVHGSCVSIGCYAMTDAYIEEIYLIADAALRTGQPYFRVHIFPFRYSDLSMKLAKQSEWYSFWMNLKTGYDYFETHTIPPNVSVKNKKYFFN